MPRSCHGTRHSQTHWFKSSGLFHRVFCDWSSVVIPNKLTPSLLISRLLLDPLGQLCSMCLSSSRIQLAIGGMSFQSGNGDRRSSSTPHVGSGSASHLLSSWRCLLTVHSPHQPLESKSLLRNSALPLSLAAPYH